jgi:hypothetical protein
VLFGVGVGVGAAALDDLDGSHGDDVSARGRGRGRVPACWCALVAELSRSLSEQGALGGFGITAGAPRNLAQLVGVDGVASAAVIEARAPRPAGGVAWPRSE